MKRKLRVMTVDPVQTKEFLQADTDMVIELIEDPYGEKPKKVRLVLDRYSLVELARSVQRLMEQRVKHVLELQQEIKDIFSGTR